MRGGNIILFLTLIAELIQWVWAKQFGKIVGVKKKKRDCFQLYVLFIERFKEIY